MGKLQPLPKRIAAGIQTLREGTIFERDAFGYFPSAFCMCSLPMRAQPGKNEYTRRYQTEKGLAGFTMMTRSEYGLPYGIYLRGIFRFITTEARKAHNLQQLGLFSGNPCEIHLGRNLTDFFNRVTGHDHGSKSGGSRSSRTLLEQQLNSFIRTHLDIYYPGKDYSHDDGYRITQRIATQDRTLFPLDKGEPEWETHLLMNEGFFEDCVLHAPPLDEDKFSALWPSPMRIDIANWSSLRANRENGHLPLVMSWNALFRQFGSDYAPESHRGFRMNFRRNLKEVTAVFDEDPDCIRFEESGDKVTFTFKRPSVLPKIFRGAEAQLFMQSRPAEIPTLEQLRRHLAPSHPKPLLDIAACAETPVVKRVLIKREDGAWEAGPLFEKP